MKPTDGRDPTASRPVRPRWLWHILLFLIPLHVGVFGLLYYGGLRLLENEIVGAHTRDAHLLLSTAVNDLHLTMWNVPAEGVHRRLESFVDSHQQMNLRLYDADGRLIAGSRTEPDETSRVAALLADTLGEHFWLVRGSETFLRGMVRIKTDNRCAACHPVGETRGVASMTRDLTPDLRRLRLRVAFYVLVGVAVWVALMALVHHLTSVSFARSASRMRDVIRGETLPGRSANGFLDPMSAALFESFAHLMRDQHEREEQFAERLDHADRLASLGRMAAGLAHEIKNPLAGIQGALEILSDDTSDASTREVYGQMLDELRRVDSTIRALLRFARPAPPHRQTTDVVHLLEETVQLLRPGFRKRRIVLDLETAPGLGSFRLDATQIRQVVVNLITNAAEAIDQDPDKNGGSIVVRAAVFLDAGGLLIAVEDDGPGMAEEDQKKIFQPFHTTKFTGTGLGLAVAERLVAQHGGSIEVESQLGRGSRFFVLLPTEVAVDSHEEPGVALSPEGNV